MTRVEIESLSGNELKASLNTLNRLEFDHNEDMTFIISVYEFNEKYILASEGPEGLNLEFGDSPDVLFHKGLDLIHEFQENF